MRYLHVFDPWNFPLCTCPVKYSIDPYTGCEHRCIYCYISTYIREPWRVRPKRDFLRILDRELRNAKRMPVSMSNSSDPYPSIERSLNLTRGTLRVLKKHDFSVLVLTKSVLVTRDRDILADMRSVVSITITTLDAHLAKKLEPFAPAPEQRLKALEKLKEREIKMAVRIDPLIPGINDSPAELNALVRELAGIGVDQIISSTYKAKPDNFRRVAGVFKAHAEELHRIYFEENEMVRGVRYAPRELRMKMLKSLRDIAVSYDIPFSVCREGLPLNTAPACDASHLLNQ
ncbi:MAG: radical SAM protein [Euryarchaeota archaeon]|nr:radical SAM protein [Euryarchaeota archaeon]